MPKVNPHTKKTHTSFSAKDAGVRYGVGVNPCKIRLIIGLGNPDKKYGKTYHNIGVLFIEYLAENGYADAELVKSNAFMNQSGPMVAKLLRKSGVKPKEILVAHDDSDIELGKYKVCFGRGSAGHKGVESIINSLSTKNFWRLRIGIGKKPKAKAEELVLKKIGKNDWEILQKTFSTIQLI